MFFGFNIYPILTLRISPWGIRLKLVALWLPKTRSQHRANKPPPNTHLNYSDSQIPIYEAASSQTPCTVSDLGLDKSSWRLSDMWGLSICSEQSFGRAGRQLMDRLTVVAISSTRKGFWDTGTIFQRLEGHAIVWLLSNHQFLRYH